MPVEAPRRRGARPAALAVAVLATFLLALLFAAGNRSQPIRLDLGLWTWRGEAVHAVFTGAIVGLLVMFLAGLPLDLRAREERRRLAERVRALERARDGEQAARRAPPTEP